MVGYPGLSPVVGYPGLSPVVGYPELSSVIRLPRTRSSGWVTQNSVQGLGYPGLSPVVGYPGLSSVIRLPSDIFYNLSLPKCFSIVLYNYKNSKLYKFKTGQLKGHSLSIYELHQY